MSQQVGFDPTDPTVGRTVLAAGFQTHYVEAGAGEPIVLLHGSGPGVSAWENWSTVIPGLAGRRRVLGLDVPGFGATEFKPDGEYNMDFWVEHLFAFMTAVGVTSAPIVGNSFGGMMAMAAALKDPSRVERIILMGTPAGEFPMSEAHKAGAVYEPDRDALGRILRLFPYNPAMVTDEMIDRRFEASVRPGAQEASRKIAPPRSKNPDGTIKAMPEASMEKIETPTLVIHGRDDQVVPLDVALRVHRAIGTSQMHTYGNCGHWVQLERRDEFVEQVLRFVEGR